MYSEVTVWAKKLLLLLRLINKSNKTFNGIIAII